MNTLNIFEVTETNNRVYNNILTGEKRKFRCHYINGDDRAVCRLMELERLHHPTLSDAGVTAWMEHDTDCSGERVGLIFVQLTDTVCYRPNGTGCYGDMVEYMNGTGTYYSEAQKDVIRENVERLLRMVAATPAALLAGARYPNMAVIAAYQDAGMKDVAAKLFDVRAQIVAQQQEEEERRRREEEEEERRREEEKKEELARQIAEEENSLRMHGTITGWGVVQLCDREGINIHLRTRHNLLDVVNRFDGTRAYYKPSGKRKPCLDGCFATLDALKEKLGIAVA